MRALLFHGSVGALLLSSACQLISGGDDLSVAAGGGATSPGGNGGVGGVGTGGSGGEAPAACSAGDWSLAELSHITSQNDGERQEVVDMALLPNGEIVVAMNIVGNVTIAGTPFDVSSKTGIVVRYSSAGAPLQALLVPSGAGAITDLDVAGDYVFAVGNDPAATSSCSFLVRINSVNWGIDSDVPFDVPAGSCGFTVSSVAGFDDGNALVTVVTADGPKTIETGGMPQATTINEGSALLRIGASAPPQLVATFEGIGVAATKVLRLPRAEFLLAGHFDASLFGYLGGTSTEGGELIQAISGGESGSQSAFVARITTSAATSAVTPLRSTSAGNVSISAMTVTGQDDLIVAGEFEVGLTHGTSATVVSFSSGAASGAIDSYVVRLGLDLKPQAALSISGGRTLVTDLIPDPGCEQIVIAGQYRSGMPLQLPTPLNNEVWPFYGRLSGASLAPHSVAQLPLEVDERLQAAALASDGSLIVGTTVTQQSPISLGIGSPIATFSPDALVARFGLSSSR